MPVLTRRASLKPPEQPTSQPIDIHDAPKEKSLEKMTVEELKQQLKRHGLTVSGTKAVLIQRLKINELRDEELRAMCITRKLAVVAPDDNGAIVPTQQTARGKQLGNRRDMISALEKFPNLLESIQHFSKHQQQQQQQHDGDDEWGDDGYGNNNGLSSPSMPCNNNGRGVSSSDDAVVPGYKPTEMLNFATGDRYAMNGATLSMVDMTSDITTSTERRVIEWLIAPPAIKCLQCRKVLPCRPLLKATHHLLHDHNLAYDTGHLDSIMNPALLLRIDGFMNVMSLYVWIRETASFQTLVSIVATKWFEQCRQCGHNFTIYHGAGDNNTPRPDLVAFHKLHDKVDLGPKFPATDTFHQHPVEVLRGGPFRVLFGEQSNITPFTFRFVRMLNVPPKFAPTGRPISGAILAETELPQIPCTCCGKTSTLTAASTNGGLYNASRHQFFCGKRCANKLGYKARLVKLKNNPRCSACRCAEFVYDPPAGVGVWEAAAEEEAEAETPPSDHNNDESLNLTLHDDIDEPASFNTSQHEDDDGSIDEIMLVPAGYGQVDGEMPWPSFEALPEDEEDFSKTLPASKASKSPSPVGAAKPVQALPADPKVGYLRKDKENSNSVTTPESKGGSVEEPQTVIRRPIKLLATITNETRSNVKLAANGKTHQLRLDAMLSSTKSGMKPHQLKPPADRTTNRPSSLAK